MTSLRTAVSGQITIAEELPLVHVTRCEALPAILAADELRSTSSCDVFHEDLVYLHYGRPAHRHAWGRKPGSGIGLCPVCFVFKPHTVGRAPRRVFACDTGGVHNGHFAPHLRAADRDEMELEPSIDSARRLIPLFFESNGRYFHGNLRPEPPTEFALGSPGRRFYELLTDTGELAGDDCRSAIEVQLLSPVPLARDLLYVVLPHELLRQSEVRRAVFERWNCDAIGYDTYSCALPHDYTAVVRDLVKRRFVEGGRL